MDAASHTCESSASGYRAGLVADQSISAPQLRSPASGRLQRCNWRVACHHAAREGPKRPIPSSPQVAHEPDRWRGAHNADHAATLTVRKFEVKQFQTARKKVGGGPSGSLSTCQNASALLLGVCVRFKGSCELQQGVGGLQKPVVSMRQVRRMLAARERLTCTLREANR